jgi:phosphatidate cytidylyltransferase
MYPLVALAQQLTTQIQYVDVGSLMQTIVTSLSTAEQLELLADLKRFLGGQGIKA